MCEPGDGGTLAIITDYEIAEFAHKLVDDDSASYYAWVGAKKEGGVWKWVDGTPWQHSNWMKNEPASNYGYNYAYVWDNNDKLGLSTYSEWGYSGRVCQIGAVTPLTSGKSLHIIFLEVKTILFRKHQICALSK